MGLDDREGKEGGKRDGMGPNKESEKVRARGMGWDRRDGEGVGKMLCAGTRRLGRWRR